MVYNPNFQCCHFDVTRISNVKITEDGFNKFRFFVFVKSTTKFLYFIHANIKKHERKCSFLFYKQDEDQLVKY